MDLTEISHMKIKYIIRKFLRIRQFACYIGESETKTITQK